VNAILGAWLLRSRLDEAPADRGASDNDRSNAEALSDQEGAETLTE
jgi:hypothetical protein